VLPVVKLDGRAVGRGAHAGTVGPVYKKLYSWYQEAKLADREVND